MKNCAARDCDADAFARSAGRVDYVDPLEFGFLTTTLAVAGEYDVMEILASPTPPVPSSNIALNSPSDGLHETSTKALMTIITIFAKKFGDVCRNVLLL